MREGDVEGVRKLLAELDGDDYAVRQKAGAELAKLSADWLPLLEEGAGRSLEAHRRVQALMRDPGKRRWSVDLLRQLRAVQALELVGSAEAKAVLRELAAGAPWSRLTQDAADALGRLP